MAEADWRTVAVETLARNSCVNTLFEGEAAAVARGFAWVFVIK